MKRGKFFASIVVLVSTFALCCACSAQNKAKIKLAENGVALMQIVSPDAPTSVEKFALTELKSHLDEITEADFKIVAESSADATKPSIYVGATRAAEKLAPDFNPKTVPPDSILVRGVGKNLVICGHSKRGTFYAVSEFLEDIGVRRWTSTEKYVPKKPDFEIESPEKIFSPKLAVRKASYLDARGAKGGTFAAHLRDTSAVFADFALRCEYTDSYAASCHSFYRILPPEKYFDAHPDWYSLYAKKNVRFHKFGQLCLSNREMLAEFVKVCRQKLEKAPCAKFIHISQNDWHGACECPECKKFEAEHGGVKSAIYLDFANRVADEIGKDFPDVKIVTFAYQFTRAAPTGIKPRKNVCVELCSIECDFAHPLESDTEFGFTKDIIDWGKLTKNLLVWDYATCFWNYMLPHPNLDNLAKNIRFFNRNGAYGIFEQGDTYCNVGDFCRLRYWLLMHLLWNDKLDEQTLRKEFLYGYYGAEVGAIFDEYLKIINECGTRTNYPQHCYFVDTLTWLDAASYVKCAELMERALDTAKALEKSDPKKYAGLVEKVEREKIPIDFAGVKNFVQLKRLEARANIDSKFPTDPVATVESLIERWQRFGTKSWREVADYKMFKEHWQRLRRAAKQQSEYMKLASKPFGISPDISKKFAQGTFVEFQEDFFFQANPPKPVRLDAMPCDYFADKNASNGFAAKLSDGSEPNRHFQIDLRKTLFGLKSLSGDESKHKYRVIARIRTLEPLPKTANVRIRISSQSCAVLPPPPQNISKSVGQNYTDIDFGTFAFDFSSGKKIANSLRLLLIPSGLKNPSQIAVDRIVVVRE